MVIRPGDRVSAVIARDERLIDVFVSLSPAFERLRSPAMRRVMARLVTIEQAARMAGVDPAELVHRLNRALEGATAPEGGGAERGGPMENRGGVARVQGAADRAGGREEGPSDPRADPRDPGGTPPEPGGIPPDLAGIPSERVVDLDVRDDLRAGREPFSQIMAARRALPADGVLRIRAIFEPVPLYAVMARQGLDHWTERFADDDWRVWFFARSAVTGSTAAGSTAAGSMVAGGAAAPAGDDGPTVDADSAGDDDVVVLDVRGLEPPEPMMRTLEALEALPPEKVLVQLNVRVPQFLLPLLEERGFTWEVREQAPDLVRVFIRRRADEESRAGAG